MPAEEVEDRVLRLLVLDVRHVGRRVEHDARGIDAVGVRARAAAAAEVAHLGRGERKAVLARARRRSAPSTSPTRPPSPGRGTLAREQQLRRGSASSRRSSR